MSRLVVARAAWWALGVEQEEPVKDPTLLHAFLLTSDQAEQAGMRATVWGAPAMCGALRQEGVVGPCRTSGEAAGENVCSPCVGLAVEWTQLSAELVTLEERVKEIRKRRTQLRNGPTVSDRLLEAMNSVAPKTAIVLAKLINHPVASVRVFLSVMVRDGRVKRHKAGFTKPWEKR